MNIIATLIIVGAAGALLVHIGRLIYSPALKEEELK